MKLIRKENGDYHLIINNEIKSLQEFNITKEDCDILTLGYSVEKMVYDWLYEDETEDKARQGYPLKPMEYGYIKGFNAHKELVKDKLFTVEDMKNALRVVYNDWVEDEEHEENTEDEYYNRIIQLLLPKTEWKVTFDEQGKLKLI